MTLNLRNVAAAFSFTGTCVDCCTLTGLAGAVLVTGYHRYCVLLVTVQVRHAAVAEGGVAGVFMPVCTHGNHVVGFGNGRGGPGHQSAAIFAGDVHNHILRSTGLCGKIFFF